MYQTKTVKCCKQWLVEVGWEYDAIDNVDTERYVPLWMIVLLKVTFPPLKYSILDL